MCGHDHLLSRNGPAITALPTGSPGRAIAGQGPGYPFSRRPGGRGRSTHSRRGPQGGLAGPGLDQCGGQGQAGQVGAAAAAGLVPDPVQVGADGADADVQLRGDLGVGAAPGDQGDQFPLPGAERPGPPPPARGGPGSVSSRAYSAAVARLIAAPRSSAARVRSGPSACRAWRCGPCRRRSSSGESGLLVLQDAARAAQTVTASAERPVAAHSCPQQSRALPVSFQWPVRVASWSNSRRCAAASGRRPASSSNVTISPAGPLDDQVAGVPGPGQGRRADGLGGGQVPGLDQHRGQVVADPPGCRAGDAVGDLLGLPGQPHGPVLVAGAKGGGAEVRQGYRLRGRVPELPGHGQGTAGLLGRLGAPAQRGQCYRPAGQAVGQHPGRPPPGGRVPQRGEMAQRHGRISREPPPCPSQICAAHHPSLPGSAHPATWRSSGY